MPTTRTVKTDGSGDYTSVATAVNACVAGDTVDIYDGTYTENVAIALIDVNDLTIKGNSGDAESVTVKTTAQKRLFSINRLTTGTLFKDLTLHSQKASQTNYLIYAANGGSSGQMHGAYTVQDCVIKSQEYAMYFVGSGSLFQRCKFIKDTSGGSNISTAIYSNALAAATPFRIDSCLFQDWYSYDIYALGGNVTVRNCTIIGGTNITSDSIYLGGNGNTIYNTIVYSNPADKVNEAFKLAAAHATNTVKNCISFGGADIDYTNCGDPTVFASLKTDADVDTDDNDIFIAGLREGGSGSSYHPHADGLAYQSGFATGYPATDLSGSTFNNPPSIGCYEAVVTGYTHTILGVAAANLTSMDGVAKADIANINGV